MLQEIHDYLNEKNINSVNKVIKHFIYYHEFELSEDEEESGNNYTRDKYTKNLYNKYYEILKPYKNCKKYNVLWGILYLNLLYEINKSMGFSLLNNSFENALANIDIDDLDFFDEEISIFEKCLDYYQLNIPILRPSYALLSSNFDISKHIFNYRNELFKYLKNQRNKLSKTKIDKLYYFDKNILKNYTNDYEQIFETWFLKTFNLFQIEIIPCINKQLNGSSKVTNKNKDFKEIIELINVKDFINKRLNPKTNPLEIRTDKNIFNKYNKQIVEIIAKNENNNYKNFLNYLYSLDIKIIVEYISYEKMK